MSNVRYNSVLNDFVPTSFNNLVDRFFNESIGRSGGASYAFVPKVDIIENEKAFDIQVAVPGMAKEDFKIDLKENNLVISGERKFVRKTDEKHFRSIETQYGSFRREFVLPDGVDGENIQAKYENGILELVVPKDEKKLLKTTIKVA
jgi:HSP20 family protein